MSTSVASSTVGLLDRPYSRLSEPPEPHAPVWSSQIESDRRQDAFTNKSEEVSSSNPTNNEPNTIVQIDNDRRETIGGLLAALTTRVEPSTRQSTGTPPQQSPISLPAQSEEVQEIQIDAEEATNNHESAHSAAKEIGNIFIGNDLSSEVQNLPPDLESMQPIDSTQLECFPPFPPCDLPMDMGMDRSLREQSPNTVKRVYEAFARLEFADGIFYLNTYQCELGRDQHAYRDALQRDREAKEAAEQAQAQPNSSSGKASQRSHQIRAAESQVQGSVVSEAGGFAGVDDRPAEVYGENANGQGGQSKSSQPSDTSVVRPLEVLHKPQLAPYDYQNSAFYQSAHALPVAENDIAEDEQPAPVTADHMPDPHSCPLIPIHCTLQPDESVQSELDALRAISRRHVKIYWSYDDSAFYMDILGRNGAFLEKQWYGKGESLRLYSGAAIQISAVQFTFRLPNVPADNSIADEESLLPSDDGLETLSNNVAEGTGNGVSVKLRLKLNTDAAQAAQAETKRRGPGRPPKNGIMSQREMKEREKAEKEAKTRVTSGDNTELELQRTNSKSQAPKEEPTAEPLKPEKRKYTKRKREDGEEEILPSIEGEEEAPAVAPPAPQPTKRARTKSVSPPYKPFDKCTPEDLARPPHNYAVLLYMILQETGEITLRQIYKQMQSRWPYFKYVVDSDGWTSSVRHNLNQEVGKLFERGRKEGKGFTWLPKPNAMEEYQAQKNKRSNAPPVPKPRPMPQKPNFGPGSGQQLTWQPSNGALPAAGRGNFGPPGSWQGQQGAGQPVPPGSQSGGHSDAHMNGQRLPPGQSTGTSPALQQPPNNFNQTAPKWCPVTFEGLAVINRFEASMMSQLSQEASFQEKWRRIFASAKDRCLHGHVGSKLEGGETNEERTIMKHISDFVQRYKNPVFEDFRRTGSPTVNGALATTTNPTSEHAAPLQNNAQVSPTAATHSHPENSTKTSAPDSANNNDPAPASLHTDGSVQIKGEPIDKASIDGPQPSNVATSTAATPTATSATLSSAANEVSVRDSPNGITASASDPLLSTPTGTDRASATTLSAGKEPNPVTGPAKGSTENSA